MEAWVAERGVEGAGDDGANQRLSRNNGADAAPQVALARAKRDERAGRASESILEPGLRDVEATAGEGSLNRPSRGLEEGLPLFVGQHDGRSASDFVHRRSAP